DQKPIDKDGNIIKNNGREEEVEIEVSKDIPFPVNVNPEKVFNDALFEGIDHFSHALTNGDTDDLEVSIKRLNEGTLQIVNERAALGARMNRLELIEDRLEQQHIIAEDTMKTNEGVDFEEAVMKLLTEEVI